MKVLVRLVLIASALLLIEPSARAASEMAPQPQIIRSVNPLANLQQRQQQQQQQQSAQQQQQQLQEIVQVDKRFWFPQMEEAKAARREETVNKLLQELSMLEINTEYEKQLQQKQQQQQQQQQRQGELTSLLLAATNRPRARSNSFLMSAPTSGPASFQMSPVTLGISGGVSSVPKRIPNGHVPCYFNAITCH